MTLHSIMKVIQLFAFVATFLPRSATSADLFNYRDTQGTDYGPQNWNRVQCPDLQSCPGWPDKHFGSVGWDLTDFGNNCAWCPAEGNSCGQHRQSPIELFRDRADPNSPNWKECEDWHWIKYLDGTCDWEDVKDTFTIERHGLMYQIPVRSDGEIDCQAPNGERRYPRLDYSKGFNNWWFLSNTKISTPSEHVQQGKRYAAEVQLSHFYEFNSSWKRVGKVAIFLQDYPGERPWHYLDKLICQWRKVEEEKRKQCNLPPAPVYKMCELFRGQTRSADDIDVPTTQITYPTLEPLPMPPARPLVNLGAEPPLEKIPMEMCEGHCSIFGDCARGLICYQRDAFEAVPGCIGGEQDSTNTDYCIFDKYGEGYTFPTDSPSVSPTTSMVPTVTPLPPKKIKQYGHTPPPDKMPLQFCEGDCDKDSECAPGLICFQRTHFQAVPGCIGGETDKTPADYCILDPYGDGYTFSPTTSPSNAPSTSAPTITASPSVSSNPTDSPTEALRPKKIKQYGHTPPADKMPLQLCEGDCDVDSHCAPGLYCFQRTRFQAIPGCIGGETDKTPADYCVFDPNGPGYTIPPTGEPTNVPTTPLPTVPRTPTPIDQQSPTEAPAKVGPTAATASPTGTVTESPSASPLTRGQISVYGWSPNKILLQCEGDCDIDGHCADGLICFQREAPYVAVPGCDGGEQHSTLMDFCIDPRFLNTAAPTGSSAPSTTPTDSIIPFTPAPSSSRSDDIDYNSTTVPKIPKTSEPTATPTSNSTETASNTTNVTDESTSEPTFAVIAFTTAPSEAPSNSTTATPTSNPTSSPTTSPSATPTSKPSDNPTSSPSTSPTSNPSLEPTASPSVKPTTSPTKAPTKNPTKGPTKNPTKGPTKSPDSGSIDCASYDNANFPRFCNENSCCSNPRKQGGFCERMYTMLDDKVEAACHDCCIEEIGFPREVAPPNEINPDIPKSISCDAVPDVHAMCKPDRCCEEKESTSDFCKTQYEKYGDDIKSICWYCCYPSKLAGFETRRELLSSDVNYNLLPEKEEKAKIGYDTMGRKVILREENFDTSVHDDDDKYFDEMYSAHKRRLDQTPLVENYDDVQWWPYEWMLKVGSEYYFRYEGTQPEPPCLNKVHWRVIKDPIRVAEHQIKELERLIAWRLNDQCQGDTAGKPREGNPDAVDVARPLQEYDSIHRKVFCECQDWPSKFPLERQWCRNWRETYKTRFEENPYNWNQKGF